MGADNVANRSAALEPDFHANTINTTWYSNGEPLTGNNIPGTCTYDAPLVPPTPDARPGYTFGGWKIRSQQVEQCVIPVTCVNNDPESESLGCLDMNGDAGCAGKGGFDQNALSIYGISDPGGWGVTWSNGDKVTGVALCSAYNSDMVNFDEYKTATESAVTGAIGETKYCWCKATHYTANGSSQCSVSSTLWVAPGYPTDSDEDCANSCAYDCADLVQYNLSFRAAIFTGLVAQ